MTNNLEHRLDYHQNGIDQASYTFEKRPVKLVFSQMFNDPQSAIAFEKKLKGWTRVKKEALINGEFENLKQLSKKKFDSD